MLLPSAPKESSWSHGFPPPGTLLCLQRPCQGQRVRDGFPLQMKDLDWVQGNVLLRSDGGTEVERVWHPFSRDLEKHIQLLPA